jgi:hypothetical protein
MNTDGWESHIPTIPVKPNNRYDFQLPEILNNLRLSHVINKATRTSLEYCFASEEKYTRMGNMAKKPIDIVAPTRF